MSSSENDLVNRRRTSLAPPNITFVSLNPPFAVSLSPKSRTIL
jgi:hypothetical protein